MKLRMNGSWLLAGVVAVTATLCEDMASAGVVITKATSTPIGDPAGTYFYEYNFAFTVTGPWVNGDYITITGLTGIDPANNNAYDIDTAVGTATGWLGSYGATNGVGYVTFDYLTPGNPNPDIPANSSVTYALGLFYVGPAVVVDSSAPTPPPLTPMITSTGYNFGGTVISTPQMVSVTYVATAVPELPHWFCS